MSIQRFDDEELISSDLDPIEDLLNIITVLKSSGFTSDLLRETHKFTDAAEIKKVSKLIGLHTNIALGLADQAFSGSSETSFLPLYYSTLNLGKVYLLFLGKRTALEQNRRHGAGYDDREMKRNDILNEEIKIEKRGTIPLIYSAITGKSITKKFKVCLDEIYPYISTIQAEYQTVTKKYGKLVEHDAAIIPGVENNHFLVINIRDPYYSNNPPPSHYFKAYPGLIKRNPSDRTANYQSRKIKGKFETVKDKFLSRINRNLISHRFVVGDLRGGWQSYTPISNRQHVFNEDICIMLAYFHLSNVVRYNPEHLNKIMDSKYWIILLALRKHGYLRFLKLMWGNFNKKIFDMT